MLTNAEPKKRKNGRAKGKRGENAVAKLFAAWWSQLEPGVEFRSTPSSGGWATPQLRGHFKVAGDLTTTAKKFCFTVEVKWREAWTMVNVYMAKPSPVWKWWAQACKSAAEEGRVPILLFRKNSRSPEWFVLLPASLASAVPRLDAWGLCLNKKESSFYPPTAVRPMLTTWEGLTRLAPAAIIKLCAHASLPALGASQARPKAKPTSPSPKPRKARQRPAQAGASSPPDHQEMLHELAMLPARFVESQLAKRNLEFIVGKEPPLVLEPDQATGPKYKITRRPKA